MPSDEDATLTTGRDPLPPSTLSPRYGCFLLSATSKNHNTQGQAAQENASCSQDGLKRVALVKPHPTLAGAPNSCLHTPPPPPLDGRREGSSATCPESYSRHLLFRGPKFKRQMTMPTPTGQLWAKGTCKLVVKPLHQPFGC